MQKLGVPNSKLPLLEWLLANGETPALFTESSSAHEADDGHYLPVSYTHLRAHET